MIVKKTNLFAVPLCGLILFGTVSTISAHANETRLLIADDFKPMKPKKAPPDPLQIELEKAKKLLKANRPQQANELLLSVLDQTTDVQSCLNLASFTESYGFPLMATRRACVSKALQMCKTQDDLLLVVAAARRFQFFEIAKSAISSLSKNAQSVDDLYQLADKAAALSLHDVVHLSLERAMVQLHSVDEYLKFAALARNLGASDLSRKVLKGIVDGEDEPDKLCWLLNQIEPLQLKDLNRYLLRKALDNAKTKEEYINIREAARQAQESDTQNVADFRAKRTDLIQKINRDRADYQDKVKEWQEKMEREKQERQKQMEETKQKNFEQQKEMMEMQHNFRMQEQSQQNQFQLQQTQMQQGQGQPGQAPDGQTQQSEPEVPKGPPPLFPGAPQPKSLAPPLMLKTDPSIQPGQQGQAQQGQAQTQQPNQSQSTQVAPPAQQQPQGGTGLFPGAPEPKDVPEIPPARPTSEGPTF